MTAANPRAVLRVPIEALSEGESTLSPDAVAYVVRVHRLAAGEAFVAFDPEHAIEADAELLDVGKRARARFGVTRPASIVAPRPLTLLQAVPKGDKMDAIVRDATELGATRIVPVNSERAIASPSEARAARWRRIAVEAARQCGRGDAPQIAPLTSMAELSALGPFAGVALDPRASTRFREVVTAIDFSAPIALLVGPEGGLTEAELELAASLGLTRASLGSIVLRAETVCAATLGALVALRP